ncbi:MAG: DUF3006 domain-containing protein [Methanosarcina sp.]
MRSFKVTLDRVENDIAVLLVRNEEQNNETTVINIPLFLLPCETIEGDILDVTITRDTNETEDARKRVSLLLDKLKNKNQET